MYDIVHFHRSLILLTKMIYLKVIKTKIDKKN